MAAVLPARHLVLPRANGRRNAVAKDSVSGSSAATADPSDPKLVSPGDMQLYAYYEPSLKADTYTITVNQSVTVPGSNNGNSQSVPGLPMQQKFDVVAPQFSIDPKDFHSFYPPQGHADQPSVLPHIILNDPHLPWERGMRHTPPISTEQQVPWLAVIPFDCNGLEVFPELRLPDDLLNGDNALYKRSDNTDATQTSAFAIQMPLSDYFKWSVGSGSTSPSKVHIPPFTNDAEYNNFSTSTTPVDVIFLNSTLFKQLFVTNNASGTPTVDLSQYQYCAHVRNINTQGMADAGVEDTGLFSVVHSLRTGPTDIVQGKAPRSQAVHLVTLEFLDQIQIPQDGEYVALISLYSWIYLCQPPLSVNFVDSMRAIGDQMKEQNACMLRLTNDVIASVASGGLNDPLSSVPQDQSLATMRKYMTDRLNAGYSLIRHRLPSGEIGVALNKSPFGPMTVKRSNQASDWPINSINGQDYLILDKYLQAMDVTYSTAWQLGRVLAMADMQFVSALGRIRVGLQNAGTSAGDTAMVNANKKVDITTKAHVLANFASNAQVMSKLSKIEVPTSSPDLRGRWNRAKGAATALDLTARSPNNPIWQHGFQAGVHAKMQKLASVKDANSSQTSTTPTVSADWATVQNWILDKALFFDSVPWHYLITDPAHLPPESIRFFHIDTVWSDCFIDGALSVANHLSKTDDAIRTAIKISLNQYLSSAGTGATDHFPQVPIYGFLLRSAVVEVFPDLHITVPFASGIDPHGRQPILVQRNIRTDTVLVLLDRLPDGGEIGSIRISQPPHQQRFSAGDYLAGDSIEFMFRKVYPNNTNQTDVLKMFGGPLSWVRPGVDRSTVKGLLAESKPGTGIVYDWDGRCLNFNVLSNNLFDSNNMADLWDSKLNSAIVGVELNDTLKYLEIKPSASLANPPAELKPPRQIYLGLSATSSSANAKLAAVPRNVRPSQLTATASTTPLPTISFALPGKRPKFPNKVVIRSQSALPSHLNLLDQTPKPAVKVGNASIGPGMKQPQFTYAIYPSTTLFDKKYQGRGFVTTTTPYPPDLIFSVNLRPAGSVLHGLSLHEVQFRIPIRGKQLRTNPKVDIMGSDGLIPDGTASAGSGARMLSNQRWVVHMDAQPAYLILRIIPRSMNMTVPIDENQSLSFRLNEVEISGDDGTKTDQGTVIIQATESFGFWQDPIKRTSWSDQGSAQTVLVIARTTKTTWP